jgi:hypothetical protein
MRPAVASLFRAKILSGAIQKMNSQATAWLLLLLSSPFPLGQDSWKSQIKRFFKNQKYTLKSSQEPTKMPGTPKTPILNLLHAQFLYSQVSFPQLRMFGKSTKNTLLVLRKQKVFPRGGGGDSR